MHIAYADFCQSMLTQGSKKFQDFDLIKTYVSKIQELEGELLRLKNLSNSKHSQFVDCVDSDDDGFQCKNASIPSLSGLSSNSDSKTMDISGNFLEV